MNVLVRDYIYIYKAFKASKFFGIETTLKIHWFTKFLLF